VITCGTEADAVAALGGDMMQSLWLWTIKEALLGSVRRLTAG